MNIISGSCLLQDGYSFKSENNGCFFYMNNIFYGHAPEKNGLFLLNLDSSSTHIHNVNGKRIKLNDDIAAYLWHCCLGHIGVKRVRSSILMDYLNHLIMNHLRHVNHSLWAK